MFVRFILAAIFAGLVAGAFFTAAQAVRVVPLILEAEKYENGHDHGAAKTGSQEQKTARHDHEDQPWGPQDGFERTFNSLISNVIVGVAYSLLLAAAILISKLPVSPRSGMVWGAVGFIVFVLAPALGLPPEVPGTVAAGVPARQAWWLATVVLTACGIALLAFRSQWYWLALGAVLIAAPHIYGAPQPVHHESLAPANLVAEFVVAAIVTAGLFWLLLGGVLGWLLTMALNRDER